MHVADSRTIVVCVGNELIADDAVGFEIYNRLKGCGARLEYCGVGGIDLLQLFNGETDLILADAVQFGAPPGTVHLVPWEKLEPSTTAISAHGPGLRETIEIGRMLYPDSMPRRITLVGVEGRCFNRTRAFMTKEVSQAIDVAVKTILDMLQGGSNGCNRV